MDDLGRPCSHFVLTFSKMLRVPKAAEIKLQQKPSGGGTRREHMEREDVCDVMIVVDQSRLQADCRSFQTLGMGPKLCHGNLKLGPQVIQQRSVSLVKAPL